MDEIFLFELRMQWDEKQMCSNLNRLRRGVFCLGSLQIHELHFYANTHIILRHNFPDVLGKVNFPLLNLTYNSTNQPQRKQS